MPSIDCFIDSQNTGFGRCVPKPSLLVYELAVPKGTRITLANAQPDTIEAHLKSLALADDPLERLYVLGKYASVTDESADPVTEEDDGGIMNTLYDGAYNWTRRFREGGLCSHTAFRKLNGQQDNFEFLLVFKASDGKSLFYIMGTKKLDENGARELAGVRYDDIFTPKWNIASGTTGTSFTFKTSMADVEQINKNRMFTPVNFAVGDLPRIQDINLVSIVEVSTGVYDVTAEMACNEENAAVLYAVLADPDAWIVKNNLGNIVDTTSVAVVGGKFRLTLDQADGDFTAATSFTAQMQPISVTSAAPFSVKYVESNVSPSIDK